MIFFLKFSSMFIFILRLAGKNPISLHVEAISVGQVENHNYYKILYPYHSGLLRSVFVHGIDYQRETEMFRVYTSIKSVTAIIASLFIVAIIILYAIRKRFALPGNDVGLCVLDCFVSFIGGRGLQMRHRFERWFFGILLIGVFFIVSVFGGDLINSVVCILVPKILTYEDLVGINPLVYIDPEVTSPHLGVHEMLR